MPLQSTNVYCIIPRYTLCCMFWFTYAILRENQEKRISQSSTRDKNYFVFDSPSPIHLKLNFHYRCHLVIRVKLIDGQIHTAEKTSLLKTETFQKYNVWHFMK
jgi:hypothetical protein